jgi:hypothetical protein
MTREPKAHDEAPSVIVDHPYTPRGEWWSLCRICGLAQAAHNSSTPEAHAAKEAHFATLSRARTPTEARRERERTHPGGRVQIASYIGDDDD